MGYNDTVTTDQETYMLKTIIKTLLVLPLILISLSVIIMWAFGMTLLLGWH